MIEFILLAYLCFVLMGLLVYILTHYISKLIAPNEPHDPGCCPVCDIERIFVHK